MLGLKSWGLSMNRFVQNSSVISDDIEELALTPKTRDSLIGMGIHSVSDLSEFTHFEILRLPGFTPDRLCELCDKLSIFGLTVIGSAVLGKEEMVDG